MFITFQHPRSQGTDANFMKKGTFYSYINHISSLALKTHSEDHRTIVSLLLLCSKIEDGISPGLQVNSR